MDNPFIHGHVVTGEQFFGREDVLGKLQGYIRTGQNLAIFGERRVGKTSLVLEALRRSGRPVLNIDLNNVQTSAEVIGRAVRGVQKLERKLPVLDRIIETSRRVRPNLGAGVDPVATTPTLSLLPHFKNPVDSMTGLIDYIERLNERSPLVVFFDEFQGLLGLNEAPSILAVLRSEIQMQASIPFIFAGSIRRKMWQIFMDHKQPFYKSAISIEIEGIPGEDILPHFQNQFDKGQRQVSLDFLQTCYDIVKGNTGDLQHLCSALWDSSSPGEVLGQETLKDALEIVWSTEAPTYTAIRRGLSDLQNRVLFALALTDGKQPSGAKVRELTGGASPSSIMSAVHKLQALEVVYQEYTEEGDYRFYMPFFRHWLIHQVEVPVTGFIPQP